MIAVRSTDPCSRSPKLGFLIPLEAVLYCILTKRRYGPPIEDMLPFVYAVRGFNIGVSTMP